MADQQQPQDETKTAKTAFDNRVQYFAGKFIMNAHDIAETYKDRPESLKAYFNARSTGDVSKALFWAGAIISAAAVLVASDPHSIHLMPLLATGPMTALGLFCVSDSENAKDKIIEHAIRSDVERYRATRQSPAQSSPH